MVDDLFSSLGLDKRVVRLEDIRKGERSLKGFLSDVGESINERESRKFREGLDSKVKLSLLHGACDAGSRLMFKFRSGTHELNEYFCSNGRGEGRKECLLCDDECEHVSQGFVRFSCLQYSKKSLMCKLQALLGDRFENYKGLDSSVKASFVLGIELWEDDFRSMLDLIKNYIGDVWELRKARLYDKNLNILKSQCQNSLGNWGMLGTMAG